MEDYSSKRGVIFATGLFITEEMSVRREQSLIVRNAV